MEPVDIHALNSNILIGQMAGEGAICVTSLCSLGLLCQVSEAAQSGVACAYVLVTVMTRGFHVPSSSDVIRQSKF